jgi:hypothetical protein
MQVDRRYHAPTGGPFSRAHIDQAAGILKSFFEAVKKKHPTWSRVQQLRGGVVAYNCGVKNVQTVAGMDKGTTGDDYSADTWARAQFLVTHFGGAANASGVSSTQPVVRSGGTAPVIPIQSGQSARSDAAVRELQSLLVKHGYMTVQEVQTGSGILGPRTRAAVARFLEDKERATTSSAGSAGTGTVSNGGSNSSNSSPQGLPAQPVSMIDGVPLYRQGDPAWGTRKLGRDEDLSIHAAGCALTATAMAISKISGQPINPGELDEYLDRHDGYVGNGIKWGVAAQARGLQAVWPFPSWSLATLDRELAAGRPVVAGVDYKQGSAGGANGTDHWVTITGKFTQGAAVRYSAHDPATGRKFTFKLESNVLRAGTDSIEPYVTTGEIRTFVQPASTRRAS